MSKLTSSSPTDGHNSNRGCHSRASLSSQRNQSQMLNYSQDSLPRDGGCTPCSQDSILVSGHFSRKQSIEKHCCRHGEESTRNENGEVSHVCTRACKSGLQLDLASPLPAFTSLPKTVSSCSTSSHSGSSGGSGASASSGTESQYLSLGYPDSHPASENFEEHRANLFGDRSFKSPSSSLPSPTNCSDTTDDVESVFDTTHSSGSQGLKSSTLSSRASLRRRTLSKTFSKMFGTKEKKEGDIQSSTSPVQCAADIWTQLNNQNVDEKWQVWESIQSKPMSEWKAQEVLVWLELDCALAMYSAKCYENIKSGQLLLLLSQHEITDALEITNPLHRIKLMLAINENRNSPTRLLPRSELSRMDHVWVSYTWLRDIGLSQYTAAFERNAVDGRVLSVITKKDVEKHLGISKKSQMTSLFRGIQLLKLLNFDKEALYTRRSSCVDTGTDLLVWSNDRVVKWIVSIDLKEYSNNLTGSGIHGALMLLDSSFTSDTLCAALGIPASKYIVQRHLQLKFNDLIKKERASLCPSLVASKFGRNRRSFRSLSFRSPRSASTEKLPRKTQAEFSTNSLPHRKKSGGSISEVFQINDTPKT